MQPSRAPWWFYILAVSFLASFPPLLYNLVWGPVDDGITLAPVGGYLTAKEVQPEKPAGRAGVQAGDRILVVNGLPIRGAFDYWLAGINFESWRPIAIKIEREGKPVPGELMRCQGSTQMSHCYTDVKQQFARHNLVELNSHSNRVQSLHGRRARAGQFAFVGYQYSLPSMGGTFEKPEAGIERDLRDLTELLGAETVVVTHSPGFGVLDPGFGETQIGSRSLAEFLAKRPFLVHIHGHSHAGFGRDGRHFNVASAGRERAMVIDLETLRHEVVGLDCPSFET